MSTQLLRRRTRTSARAEVLDVTFRDVAGTRPVLRPPLKRAGGKRWQVPHLLGLWRAHRHRRLVEPFCGGLAVTLGLMPEQGLLNDINPHVINFYRWLGRGLTIDLPMKKSKRLYYRYRRRFNQLLSDGLEESAEAAALFYDLNRTGYNGLCRFNQQGGFDVPFGRCARIHYTTEFPHYRESFARWEFTQYSRNGFRWEDQVRAAEWLARHRGPVVLSNQATPRIVSLYEKLGYTLRFLKAPRRTSCTGDRTPAREVLALRNF